MAGMKKQMITQNRQKSNAKKINKNKHVYLGPSLTSARHISDDNHMFLLTRDEYYQGKMKEQMVELDQLKDEKTRLLTIQSQLQTLHDRYQQVSDLSHF